MYARLEKIPWKQLLMETTYIVDTLASSLTTISHKRHKYGVVFNYRCVLFDRNDENIGHLF